MQPRVFGVTGWSGTGKTTLIEKLIPWFSGRGLHVSVIKQAHDGFDPDQPGKDSYRHRVAGALEVLVASSRRWALMREVQQAAVPTLDEHVSRLSSCDLVLVEGFRLATLPKIEVWRSAEARKPMYLTDCTVIGIASDVRVPGAVHRLPLDDVPAIGHFILEFGRSSSTGLRAPQPATIAP